MISGPGMTVEIEKSKFGKRKYNRSKTRKDMRMIQGVENDKRDASRNISAEYNIRIYDPI